MTRYLAIALALGLGAASRFSPEGTAGQPRSLAIYPEQHVALRFSHATHLDQGMKCLQCHFAAKASGSASDRLIPAEAKCKACHDIDEARAGKQTDPPSSCDVCHPGFDFTVQQAPEADLFPRAAIKFSHAAHLARGAQCVACHGDFAKEGVVLASRDQLPKMASCLACHDGRQAPSSCQTCHFTQGGAVTARLETVLPGGVLRPAFDNPFGLDHGPRFERAHALIAETRRDQCMSCHAQSECLKCHDGSTKPMAVHPNDWISIHPLAAKLDEPRCDACHRRQSFCAACHERVGVGANAPAAFRNTNVRVHPPTAIWVGTVDANGVLSVGPGHHSIAAERNISSCASCHREEECISCHSAARNGGSDPTPIFPPFNGASGPPHEPVHPAGFLANCRQLMQKNADSCRKCHTLGDPNDAIARCR